MDIVYNFNPRSREGSDLTLHICKQRFCHFNPRSREGSDFFDIFGSLRPIHFNPRSREGSDPLSSFKLGFTANFNPRSREGSDFRCIARLSIMQTISIHAPARGATYSKLSAELMEAFQSTLPRGERLS